MLGTAEGSGELAEGRRELSDVGCIDGTAELDVVVGVHEVIGCIDGTAELGVPVSARRVRGLPTDVRGAAAGCTRVPGLCLRELCGAVGCLPARQRAGESGQQRRAERSRSCGS